MSAEDSYSNHFKAKVALEASNGTSVQKLSKKYLVSDSKIKNWVQAFEGRVDLLFKDDFSSNPNISAANEAALLKSSFEVSPNGILVTDLDRNIIVFNQKCVEMWKIPADVVNTGNMNKAMQKVYELVENPEEFKKEIDKSYEHPESRVSNVIKLKDGRFFERHSYPYRIGKDIRGRIANFIDVTVFKNTEQKLTRFSNLLESINANVNEGILRSTPDKGLVYVNEAFVNMFGYDSMEEVLNIDPAQFYAKTDERKSLVERLKNEGYFNNAEVLYKRKDGSTFWGLENCTLVDYAGEIYIDGVVTNIDNRKSAEEERRRSEEKYRSILKNLEEGYFETNLKGDFTFFNAALVDILGYPAQQIIGMNNRDYLSEDEAEKVFRTFNKVHRTGQPEKVFNLELIRPDQSRLYAEASVTLRRGPDGNPVGFSGMVRDITDRKLKNKQIRDSLIEKEVLLGEIHHRVKNNLAIISGLLYLQADKTEDERASRALMQSQNRINSIALIHELLYDNHTFSSLNPQKYIEQLVQHISANLGGKQSDITTTIQAENFDLEMSTAIPCALIINELITNAYKYAFTDHSNGKIKVIFQKTGINNYRLEVTDNGRGLPDEFDINDSSQHGLGLSLVKTLTRQLKGQLKTKKGKGAQFIIIFER